MASLLSFVKRVANTVNNDVVKPIQRDVIHPAAQIGNAVYHGVSPFDNGQGWTNQAPQRPQAPQYQASQGGNQLQVRPVQQARLAPPTFHVAPTANLQVHVAPPQPLQVGNQTIQPSPTIRTQTPARNAFLQQQLHPDLAQQVKAGLERKLALPLNTAQTLGGEAQQIFGRPAVTIAGSLAGKQRTFNTPITRALAGNTPVQNLQKNVINNYQTHSNLPTPLRVGLAGLDAAGQIANAIPDLGAVAKGAKVGATGLKIANDARIPLGANKFSEAGVGAVGKNVNAPNEHFPVPTVPAGVPKLPSEFNPQVTKQLTQNAPKDLGAEKNPLVGKVEVPAAQDAGQAHLNAQYVAGHEQRVGAVAQTELAKLSPKDQNLMRGIQINGVQKLAPKAENPQQFVKTEGALRNYYNLRHAYDQSLGIPTPYRQNYLRDIVPKAEVPSTFEAKGGNLRPGYTQAKTQPGVTPVAEGLAKDIAGSSFNHAKLTYAKGLEEAYPNQISRGAPIVGPEGVTQQLTTPYGNELFATKDLANKVNERGVAPPTTGALAKYDNVNAFMKYVKLSGGAFHAFTEAGNFAGQQLMSGKLFTEPGSMGKVFKVFLSPKALDKEAAALRANGTFDKAELSGLTWTPKAIKADVSVTPRGAVAKYTGIKALHDATFQRELPYIKLKTFEQKTQGLDIHNPADLARMRSIAKGINSEIGGQNRLLEGSLTPKQARVTARFLLATDFTEGKVRTVLAALSKGGEEGKLAREVVAGKALVFAGLATGGAAVSGNLQGKSPTQIAQTVLKNFADPSWTSGKNTVSLPATHISEFTKPFGSFFNGNKDKFYGLKHYASSRLAAVPAEATQLVNNMDYTGNHIYGKNTKKNGGKPISGPQTAVNVAKGVLPIPVGQATSAVQGKQSPLATAGNIAGLRVYPTPAKKTTTPTGNIGNRALTKRQKTATNPDELMRWEGMTAKARANVRSSNPDKYVRDQSLKVQQEQAQGNTTQAFKDNRTVQQTQIQRNFDKNTVAAYGLNATDFKAFAAQASPTQLDQLHSLDNQLVNAGLVSKSNFPKAKSTKSGSSRVASGRSSGTKIAKTPKVAKVKAVKVPSFKIKGATAFKQPKGVKVKKLAAFKQPRTRKLAVSHIPKIQAG